jgi:hypothetical protein
VLAHSRSRTSNATAASRTRKGRTCGCSKWALPEDAEIDDPEAVKQVNPASWITKASLVEQRDAVRAFAFRRFHANQWVERAGH